jgi:hypothetical protein
MQRPALALLLALAAAGCGSGDRPASGEPAPPAATGSTAAAPASPITPATACGVLSAAEIAAALKVTAVAKDDVNSGRNELNKVDTCSWFVKKGQPEGVMVKVRYAPTPEAGPTAFLGGKLDIQSINAAVDVPNLGAEAVYAPYADGRGGTLLFRQGQTVVTLIGSPSRETLVDLARIALPRMR